MPTNTRSLWVVIVTAGCAAALLSGLLWGCNARKKGDAESDAARSSAEVQRELRRLTDEYNRAILARDGQAMDRLLAKDYRFGHESLVSKADHIRAILSSDQPADTQTVDTVDVRVFGDTAIVTGLATATRKGKDRTDSYRLKFRWVNVWVKRDAGWQVVYNQSTVLPK